MLYQVIIIYQYREDFQGGISTVKHLSLTGYGIVLGILLPAVGGVMALLYTKKIFNHTKAMVVVSMFCYCVMIYTCLMRPVILYYYYYGRYLAPYVSIVLILAALAVNQISKKIVYLMGIVSLVILAPYERTLLMEQDDTRVTWSALFQLSEAVEGENKVLIDREDMKYYYLPLRAMKGVEAYPWTEAIEIELINGDEKLFFISSQDRVGERSKEILNIEYQMSEDNNEYAGKWIIFPLDVTKTNKHVELWSN